LNDEGIINFDANDFDEGYIGPFTWDVKRLAASLNLIGYEKGFSDDEIQRIVYAYAGEYLEQVDDFCRSKQDRFALTLKNTDGKINELLNQARIKSHVALLDSKTIIENYDRKFIRNKYVSNVDKDLYEQLMQAFRTYLETVPENKKYHNRNSTANELVYTVKDIVQCASVGIGSAGKVSYLLLLEGRSETLENDVILYMKPAQKSALSYVITNADIDKYFAHDGLRTVLCSYAMQASTPRWLGYTTLNGMPFLVDAVTAHAEDLRWSNINDINDIVQVARCLGKVTGRDVDNDEYCSTSVSFVAKIHCVTDADCVNTPSDISSLPFNLIPQNAENSIRDAIQGRNDEFIDDIVEFAMVNERILSI
jgi:uncharacterized protein (DUF2252 family)